MFGVLFNLLVLVRTCHFCINLQAMVSRATLPVSLTKDYGHFLRKVPNTDFHPGLIVLSAGVLSRKHFMLTINDGVRRKASECMPLTTGKMNIYVLLTLGQRILLHIHISTNSHLVVQWKHWKGKWKNYKVNMSLPLPIKQQITSSLSEKDTTWMFWRRNWILRVHMYLLSWRKTIFCVISILSLNQISKLINLTCLHFIGCRNYTKNPYKSRFISNSSHCSTTSTCSAVGGGGVQETFQRLFFSCEKSFPKYIM